MLDETDLFRYLPVEILCKILSLLPTKQAVSTSVLSKRWRNLIAFVPNIDIDDSVFLYPEKDKRKKDGIQQSFMNFVDRVLALQGNSPIESFSLKCRDGVDSDRVNRWIRNVIQRGVSEFRLFIDLGDEIYQLPREIFVSNTLVKLKIGSKIGFSRRNLRIFFPVLKNLVLDSIEFTVAQIKMLLSACPVLEELNINHIDWTNTNVTVSSESLKELVVLAHGVIDFLYLESISFNAPNVVSLSYSDIVAEDYPQVNFTNLVDAIINLSLTDDQFKQVRAPAPNIDLFGNDLGEENDFPQFANVWKFFYGIRNVQKLFLAPDTLEVLSLCGESMPVFNNLKIMRIQSDPDRGWQAMPVLLSKCPHLETIIFEGLFHYPTDKCGDTCDCISREDKGRSLLSCPVKLIEIKAFRGTNKEIHMIKHFLEYFKCLKKMEIYPEEYGYIELTDPLLLKCTRQMIQIYSKFSTCDVRLHFGKNTSISRMIAYNSSR